MNSSVRTVVKRRREKQSVLCAFAAIPLLTAAGVAAPQAALSFNAKSKVAIVVPQKASLPEQTAARELDNYLTKITGGDFQIRPENAFKGNSAIYVGNTQFARRAGVNANALESEKWVIKTQKKNLVLAGGGTRGTLYATYHFLEDYAGVHWWNPFEEFVPARRVLTLANLNRSEKPTFSYRDIYMLYGRDEGRFAIRNRLNRDGDATVGAQYGGSRDYGPPYHVHTLYMILPPSKYFKDHPDWYLYPKDGEPNDFNSQLHMSNPEMRAEFLKNLKDIIRKSHADAKAKGLPAPDVFSVSQMDNMVKFEGPNDAAILAENGGAESAILLDFINYLADGIKDEFPGVYVDTLAYFSGEKAPTKIRPRDNVIIRLTDTTSNYLLPITHPRNHVFHDNIVAWGKITKNLRVWDYAVTYVHIGFPVPTANTYQPDLKFWKANNVDGIFVEHEFPVLGDMRDFKVWMQCKLYENPNREYSALEKTFTDGFYGKAGVHIRRYLRALEASAAKTAVQDDIHWMVAIKPYRYLSADFVVRAHAMFDDAERAVAGNRVLMRRVRHARLSLDQYTLRIFRKLVTQRAAAGHSRDSIPLDPVTIADRYLQTRTEQADLRFVGAERVKERNEAAAEAEALKRLRTMKIPARFKDVPASHVEVYGAGLTRNYANQAKFINDPEAESGNATRLLLEDTPEGDAAKYTIPMPLGVYDTLGKKELLTTSIKAEDVPGAGYHWYKIGETKLTGNDYVYFFWSWNIQLDIADAYDDSNPNQVYEVWVNVKFEGAKFPHGKATDKDAISVGSIVLVRK